jgi:recombination protein RecR
MLPKPLEKLINSIAFLPGIGEKTATKLAFFLLKANREYVANFAKDLSMLQNELVVCSRCGGYTDRENIHCNVCRSTQRDASLLCVVEDFLDMISLERLHIFQGYYHILGGSISPIHGIYPENLRFKELFDRLEKEPIREIIIAANPNIE